MAARRIYLIDASAIVYRSYFAFLRTPLVNSRGENVSAVYGFLQTVLMILKGEGARYAAVAFDAAGPTFRHERFETYKANRPAMPDDLSLQLPIVRDLVEAMGIVIHEREGFEADDLIASLAVTMARSGEEAVIVSPDKDFQQLVTGSILQWIPPRGKEPAQVLGVREVEERWGVPPERVLDVLALMGDTVDNVPGVPGIGPKTASDLIRSWSSLEGLYENLEAIPRAALREKLALHREQAFLSRELIRLRTDLLSAETIDRYVVPDPSERPGLLPLLRRLEFRKVIEALALHLPRQAAAEATRVLRSPGDLEAFLATGAPSRAIGVDLSLAGEDPRTAEVAGLAVAVEEGVSGYLPLGQPGAGEADHPAGAAKHALETILGAEGREAVVPVSKPLLHACARLGVEARARIFDAELAAYLIDPEGDRGLEGLAESLLGASIAPLAATGARRRAARTGQQVLPEEAAGRAGERAAIALRLREPLLRSLRDRALEDLYRTLELPLASVLVAMERAGIHVEAGLLRRQSEELAAELRSQEEEIHRLAGRSFNILSPPQLGEVLFKTLGLPTKKKIKTGYSTDSDVLEELAADHPIARRVLDYRQLSKLRSTYLDALPGLIDPRTGRIHGRFHQTVAATGRLSSTDPNLQNIPIRTPQGRRIRQAFTPQQPGDVLISADYSQIELRILAHLSQDPGLLSAFRSGEDIHAATAARIFDTPIASVDPLLRSRAKTVNFGVLYGMGPHRLAREMGIPFAQARAFIDHYFAKMPGVRTYLEGNLSRARREGYVSTLLGRRRFLPALRGEDARARAQAERIAANTPIQGSAADLIKRAMVVVHESLRGRRAATRLILQVHDELLLEGPASECEQIAGIVRRAMEEAASLSVPLTVEIGWGSSWEAAHAPPARPSAPA